MNKPRTLLNQQLLQCDTKNANGRIYPKVEVINAIAVAPDPISVIVEHDNPSSASIPLEAICGIAENMRIENGYVLADISLIGTPKGHFIEDMLCKNVPITFSVMGYGSIDESMVVQSFSIFAISADIQVQNKLLQ